MAPVAVDMCMLASMPKSGQRETNDGGESSGKDKVIPSIENINQGSGNKVSERSSEKGNGCENSGLFGGEFVSLLHIGVEPGQSEKEGEVAAEILRHGEPHVGGTNDLSGMKRGGIAGHLLTVFENLVFLVLRNGFVIGGIIAEPGIPGDRPDKAHTSKNEKHHSPTHRSDQQGHGEHGGGSTEPGRRKVDSRHEPAFAHRNPRKAGPGHAGEGSRFSDAEEKSKDHQGNKIDGRSGEGGKSDQKLTTAVRMIRGPKRSDRIPEGVWARAYPRVKAERIQPNCLSVRSRPPVIEDLAVEIAARSI